MKNCDCWQISTQSPEETKQWGIRLGQLLKDGDVLCLQGDLGAGKTALTKGIAEGMGILPESVTSPTFAILNIYEGQVYLYHFDLYRLDMEEELEHIGFYEYVGRQGVTVIEWPDRFFECLPEERLVIEIFREQEGKFRQLCWQASGERYCRIVEGVKEYAGTGN